MAFAGAPRIARCEQNVWRRDVNPAGARLHSGLLLRRLEEVAEEDGSRRHDRTLRAIPTFNCSGDAVHSTHFLRNARCPSITVVNGARVAQSHIAVTAPPADVVPGAAGS
jgi:hypothetical protein